MYARAINVRTLLIAAAALAIVLLVGAGVAYATGSSSSDDSSEQQKATGGADIEKAKSVALEHTNGGQVSGTEIGDEEGYYEVEVTRDDGSQVDIHLDREFNVLSTPADHEGPENNDAPDDDDGGG